MGADHLLNFQYCGMYDQGKSLISRKQWNENECGFSRTMKNHTSNAVQSTYVKVSFSLNVLDLKVHSEVDKFGLKYADFKPLFGKVQV